jgi:hypothetical protein
MRPSLFILFDEGAAAVFSTGTVFVVVLFG